MKDEEYTERRRKHGSHALIPAGVLIGLGIGLLAGYPGSGVLIGLGLGFILSALMRPSGEGAAGSAAPSMPGGMNWMMLIIGVFMILIGAGLIIKPFDIWPYVVSGFLILLGLWFVVRGYKGHF